MPSVGAATHDDAVHGTQFGANETTQNLALERAGVAAHIRSTLMKDANALSGAARNADRITQGDTNQIDAGRTQKLADYNRDAVAVFDRLKNAKGRVSDILNAAAKKIADGENTTNVYKDALRAYRTAAEEEYTKLRSEGHPTVDSDSAGNGEARPRPEGMEGTTQLFQQRGGQRPSTTHTPVGIPAEDHFYDWTNRWPI